MSVPTRTLAVLAGLLALTAALLANPAAQASRTGSADPDRSTVSKREAKAARALTRAKAALSGEGGDATMALRHLMLLKDALSPADRAAAEKLAGRPTNATFVESGNIRVHYTPAQLTGGFDQNAVLNTALHVSQAYSGAGYRTPLTDGSRGGNSKTDIYVDATLQDGLYGYCTSDDNKIGQGGKYDTWAFCVVNNDYDWAPANNALENLQVTIAHEYYHATQFAYDFLEDDWFMEATAAWAEDELYDAVDDNRQYLASSPLTHPQRSMDKFGGSFHYGSWIFFRYLSERFPQQKGQLPKVLLDFWKEADSSKGPKKDEYSVQAINKVLKKRKLSLDKAFALFSDINRRSQSAYNEGNALNYPIKRLEGGKTLKKGKSKQFKAKLDHLSSATYRYAPKGLGNKKFKLKLSFDMAPKSQGSRAVVTTYKSGGGVKVKYVKLNGKGNAILKVGFSTKQVDAIEVTLVNASTRYQNCYNQDTPFSCSGKPEDQKVKSAVRGTVTKS